VIKIQKNRAYTQVLEILNNLKLEDYNKVPEDLITTLEEYKDDDIRFKYDTHKDYMEQNISSEAKLILAIFFKRYWASDEKKEQIRVYEINKLTAIEEAKQKIYPKNVISDSLAQEKIEEKRQKQLEPREERSVLRKIIDKIIDKFFKSKPIKN